jgi:hypothetical protein
MPSLTAVPSFGGRTRVQAFYEATNRVINTLRPLATLRTIAAALNQANFATPTGKAWTRERLATYLRSSAYAESKQSTHSYKETQ